MSNDEKPDAVEDYEYELSDVEIQQIKVSSSFAEQFVVPFARSLAFKPRRLLLSLLLLLLLLA